MYRKWCLLNIKRKLKSPALYIVSFMMVIFFALTTKALDAASDNKTVLICAGDSVVGQKITDELVNNQQEGYIFIEEVKERLEERVKAADASVAILFTDKIDKAANASMDMEKNQTLDSARDGVIIYESSDSIDSFGVKEYVFPLILKNLSRSLLSEYMREYNLVDDEGIYNDMIARHDAIQAKMAIRIYNIKEIDTPYMNKRDYGKGVMIFVKLLALCLLFLFYYIEERSENVSFYKAFAPNKRISFMGISVAFSVVFTLIILWLGYNFLFSL